MSDALERLIEAVAAGSIRSKFDPAFERAIYPQVKAMSTVYLAGEAYCGSLDAANDLHGVLLPGWTACVGQNAYHGDWNAFVRLAQDGSITREQWGGTDGKPARAWLLAILRAKLAENHPRQETSD